MVVNRTVKQCAAGIFIAALFFLESCTVDLFGLFGSNDLGIRLADRNTFQYLSPPGSSVNGNFVQDRDIPLGDAYSFIVLSDTHIDGGDAHGLEKLKDVIGPEDKFVVITGDITQSGKRADLQKFKAIAGTFGVPCYPVLGNHDIYFNNWPVWRELIGSSSYRIDHDKTTLFILDSANAFFGSAQLNWLAEELGTAKSHVFVFTHTNLFVKSPADIEQLTDIRERARIMSLLKDRCDALFMGHVHQRIIKEAGGVQYITIEDFRDNGTYCRVYVSDQGLRYEFKKL
jgi:predicted phosphodiesterase